MDQSDLKAKLERYHAESFGWARACCRQDVREAEDVLQTAYLKILDGRAKFSGLSAFRTWLFAVIRHTALDARRRRRLRHLWLVPLREETEPESEEAPDSGLDLDRQRTRFRVILARLPQRQSAVLQLVFYHDLTLKEAAEVLGISLGSARTHYARGKNRLRQWIEEAHESRRPNAEGMLR